MSLILNKMVLRITYMPFIKQTCLGCSFLRHFFSVVFNFFLFRKRKFLLIPSW